MRREKAEILWARYQRLYRNRIGFSCGEGWFDIIDRLSSLIENEIIQQEKDGVPEDWRMAASDVKEKYGTLRFNLSPHSGDREMFDRIEAAIDAAEGESERTCESCGAAGSMKGEHDPSAWMHVSCELCEARSKQRRPRP